VHPFAADLPSAVDRLERLAPLLAGAVDAREKNG
jgi:hypothetical protein